MPINLFGKRNFEHRHDADQQNFIAELIKEATNQKQASITETLNVANGYGGPYPATIQFKNGQTTIQPIQVGDTLTSTVAYVLNEQTLLPGLAFGWLGRINHVMNTQTSIDDPKLGLEFDALRNQFSHLAEYRLNSTDTTKSYHIDSSIYPTIDALLTATKPEIADGFWEITTIRKWLDWLVVGTFLAHPLTVVTRSSASADLLLSPHFSDWMNDRLVPLAFQGAAQVQLTDELYLQSPTLMALGKKG